ncbi:hypothetical protein, partial [Vineibacter terrae]|uniref:hypothetical protein n=1 Tax=Vineibacter terrae TaxID=2586908 RepID=UPI002E35F98D
MTFKPKDQRREKSADKLDILLEAVPAAEQVNFYDVASSGEFAIGAPGVTPSLPEEAVGYDVNLYEAPIVTLSLSDDEIKALKGNPNIAAVEDDGVCYALPFDTLQFEGQPSVLAETVPFGVQQIKAPTAWGYSRG